MVCEKGGVDETAAGREKCLHGQDEAKAGGGEGGRAGRGCRRSQQRRQAHRQASILKLFQTDDTI